MNRRDLCIKERWCEKEQHNFCQHCTKMFRTYSSICCAIFLCNVIPIAVIVQFSVQIHGKKVGKMSDKDTGKTRSKNFTENENKVLISACDKFHEIINKNSSSDADKLAKNKAWANIKNGFDVYCKSQGIFVSKN